MVDIGYDSFNSLLLLQTMSIMLLLYIIKMFIFLLIVFIQAGNQENCVCLEKVKNKVEKIFFNPLIELIIGGYFEFLISILLTLQLDEHKISGEALSYFVMIVTALLCLVFLPIALIIVIFYPTEKLLDKNFVERASALY